jgi:hypothetical protein
MLESEINSNLDVLKGHLRTVTKEGDVPKASVPAAVTDSIDFLCRYFKHPKNRLKYSDKLAETKRILRIGAERGMIGDFNIEKLKYLDDTSRRSVSIASERSKKDKGSNKGLKASTDISQQGDPLDYSKHSISMAAKEKEELLQNKVMEEMQNFQKNREAMTAALIAKRAEVAKSLEKGETLSTASVPVIEKAINSTKEGSHVHSTLPAINRNPASLRQGIEFSHSKPGAENALRTLLRKHERRPKNSTARQRPHHMPIPHSFYSLLDQSREHSRSTSAHRSALSADRPSNPKDRAQKGPSYDLLFK